MRRQIINFSTEQLCEMPENSAQGEMYPECVIASWDALVFLLDVENIERKVQLKAEKNRVYANYKLQEKTAPHDMQICVSRKQFLSAHWLFTVNFTVNFQKSHCAFLSLSSVVCSYVSIAGFQSHAIQNKSK